MRAFSAQPVDAEQFTGDWWYAQSLREAGLLSTRSVLVNLTVNGKDWELYVLRDAFTEQWLASQGRRKGAIVRLDERLFWERRAQLEHGQAGEQMFLDPISSLFELEASAGADVSRAVSVGETRDNSGEIDAALELLRAYQERRVDASQAFDPELLGWYIAHANLWGARHGLMWSKARYYYNPSTARLEPIGHDARALAPKYASLLDLAQFEDLAVMEAYAREVARISQPGYLVSLRAEHADSFAPYEAVLSTGDQGARVPWDLVAERQVLLSAALHPLQMVRAYEVGRGPDEESVIQVGNLLRYPVVLEQLVIGDRALDIQPEWIVDAGDLVHAKATDSVILRGLGGTVPGYLSLRISADELAPLLEPDPSPDTWTAQIVTRLVGVNQQVVVDVQPDNPLAISLASEHPVPTVQEALDRHPWLERGERPGFLALKAGTWAVDGDLVLPRGMGLEATRPVTLAFEPGATLFATGPLWLHGPDEGGVHLVPQHESWAGLIVYRAGSEATSSLRNVGIRGTQGVRLSDGGTSGGATFYESPVLLDRCRLVDSTAPDTLHVVGAQLEIADTEFGNISGDAFRGDRVQGRVVGGTFHDVLGNGIDVSSSRIEVLESHFVRIHGQAISARKGSLISVQDVRVADAGLALASRDMSYVRAHGLHMEQVWLAGLVAYGQEWAQGQASLEVTRLASEGDVPLLALVQPGNHATVEGVEVEPSAFDVAVLDWRNQDLFGVQVQNHRFGDELRLLGYALDASGVDSGAPLRLFCYGQALPEIEREYTVFVHALDASGQLVAQWDAMPRENEYPTTHWLAGRVVDDPHILVFPPGLEPGSYQLAVGLYFWQTGERLPIEGPDGTRVPDGALVLEPRIEIE
jgi:hypothetical protein